MDNKQSNFRYTYSAKEQAEIHRIRSKYLPREESRLEQLQRLDASVTRRPTIAAVTLGIIGALILGTGMSCCMVFSSVWFIPGILIGVIGLVLVSLTYPMYTRLLQKERKRIAPEILRLTDELMK